MSKRLPKTGESLYGMGDKATTLKLKGKRISNWLAIHMPIGKDHPSLYKAHSFLCGLTENKAYGFL